MCNVSLIKCLDKCIFEFLDFMYLILPIIYVFISTYLLITKSIIGIIYITGRYKLDT